MTIFYRVTPMGMSSLPPSWQRRSSAALSAISINFLQCELLQKHTSNTRKKKNNIITSYILALSRDYGPAAQSLAMLSGNRRGNKDSERHRDLTRLMADGSAMSLLLCYCQGESPGTQSADTDLAAGPPTLLGLWLLERLLGNSETQEPLRRPFSAQF